MVSIPACHAGDRGSIPRHGELLFPEVEISRNWEFIDLEKFNSPQDGLDRVRETKVAGSSYFDNRLYQAKSTSKLT